MPKREELLQRLRAAFAIEANEHCLALSSALLELESAAGDEKRKRIETMFRSAHSLKGAARAVNLPDVEAVCQKLESLFVAWKRQPDAATAAAFDTLHAAVDAIATLAGAPAESAAGSGRGPKLSSILTAIEQLEQGRAPVASTARIGKSDESLAPSDDSLPSSTGSVHADPTVRLALERVERVLYGVEELLSLKSMLAQRIADLREATTLLERWRIEWSRVEFALHTAGVADGREARPEFAVLRDFVGEGDRLGRAADDKLATLARVMERDRHELAKLVDHLLDDTKTLLLLPFSTDFAFYSKLVRDLARQQGKDVEFVFGGGDVEVDKRTLEQMKDPLVHLLRNCIDHGMEVPVVRARLGKPERGTITLAATQLDDQRVELLIEDDGAGIDLDAVKLAAVRRGLLTAADLAKMTDDEALALIFRADVTTAPIVTEISGRGIGLAIVQERVEKLDGRMTVRSERKRGTAFRIVLPVAQATFRGVLVSTADQLFIVPATKVERVQRVAAEDIKTVENRDTVTVAGRTVPLVRLADVLELPRRTTGMRQSPFTETFVAGAADRRIAFAVDAILREEEVLVKPFRKPLCRVRNVAGATVLGSGEIVPILNLADLLKSAARATARAAEPQAGGRSSEVRRRILVVEDSFTSRTLLKNILESAGYAVKTAVDGLDALTILRAEPVELVVSDLEMPRMNGFALTAAIRGDRKLAEVPVVLVTALASREDRERGIDVGANAYLVKSDFDQSNLLEAVRRLIGT